MEKKRDNLNDSYEGVMGMRELPKALFIMGLKSESTVVKEAKIMNIPIISICDTDTNPVIVDYLIPGNDDGNKSVAFFAKMIADAIKEGKNFSKEEVVPTENQESENTK